MSTQIKNINPSLGDSVKFDSVDEMAAALRGCGSAELSEAADNLVEGVDYEAVEA